MRNGGPLPVISVISGALALLLAGYAQAQNVTIELTGQVPISCRLEAPATQINLGNITAAGNVTIPFRVRCNAPFLFALASRSGALTTDEAGSLRPDFTDSVPYDATVRIPTNVGVIAGNCSSSALRAMWLGCLYPDSRQGVALEGEASLIVSWDLAKQPIAGIYSDVVTLAVGPRN